jgi:hypothetical protein
LLPGEPGQPTKNERPHLSRGDTPIRHLVADVMP